MRVRIIIQPTGLLNGAPWPAPGEELDLPDDTAEGMAEVGHVELVKTAAKKAAAPPKPEKRPAPTKTTETRKG